MLIGYQNFNTIINRDSCFKNLGNLDLNNSVCFFEHNKPVSFKYHSPISLRYVNEGSVCYKSGHNYTNMSSNKLFYLTEPILFESNIDTNRKTKGLSIFFDEQLINERLIIKLKGHQFLIDNPDAKPSSVISELLVPKIENNLLAILEYCFKKDFKFNQISAIVEKILESFLDYEIQEYYKSENLILNKNSTKKEIIRRLYLAKCFIHDNYKNNILLEDIAKSAFLSKYIFQRYFKSYFQISPSDYLVELRIKKAKELLNENTLPISLIAAKCGFNSPQHFNYTFSKFYGSSPTLFKKKCA